jgi:hypothetical protein
LTPLLADVAVTDFQADLNRRNLLADPHLIVPGAFKTPKIALTMEQILATQEVGLA